jgi:hypothetical protein
MQKLLKYNRIPVGFEMVYDPNNIEAGKFWNLWFNITKTDNPKFWDREILQINRLQKKLECLPINIRLLRSHIAEFCRHHPLFPINIDLLCEEIAKKGLSNDYKIGCDGRDLLESLGYHCSNKLYQQQKETLKKFSTSLLKWLDDKDPNSPEDYKIFGYFGSKDKKKEDFAIELVSILTCNETSIKKIRNLMRPLLNEFETSNYIPLYCINCNGVNKNRCVYIYECTNTCCVLQLIFAGLLCINGFDNEISIYDEFSRFSEEYILAYANALLSWMKSSDFTNNWIENPTYCSKKSYLNIHKRINNKLREKNDIKVWLSSCLLKTIKDNRKPKRSTLVDNYIEMGKWIDDLDTNFGE